MRWLFFLVISSCAVSKPEPPSQPTSQLAAITQPSTSPMRPAAQLAPSTTQAALSPRCATIEAVLDAQVYRGSPPKSQSQIASAKAYAGKNMERDDHFLKYVACEYKVAIQAAHYSYKDYISDVTLIDEMRPEMCEAQRAEFEALIERVTKRCTDLKGGEYYGYIFTPLK